MRQSAQSSPAEAMVGLHLGMKARWRLLPLRAEAPTESDKTMTVGWCARDSERGHMPEINLMSVVAMD